MKKREIRTMLSETIITSGDKRAHVSSWESYAGTKGVHVLEASGYNVGTSGVVSGNVR